MKDPFDGFEISIKKEGNEYLAHFIELPNVSAYGDTYRDALRELEVTWGLMKESYKDQNEPIPVPQALTKLERWRVSFLIKQFRKRGLTSYLARIGATNKYLLTTNIKIAAEFIVKNQRPYQSCTIYNDTDDSEVMKKIFALRAKRMPSRQESSGTGSLNRILVQDGSTPLFDQVEESTEIANICRTAKRVFWLSDSGSFLGSP